MAAEPHACCATHQGALSVKKLLAIAIAAGLGFSVQAHADRLSTELIKPIEPATITEPEKAELGKKLRFDPRLSMSGFISCNSCHNLSTGGSDNLPTSIGHNWQQGPINSPTDRKATLSVA